MRARAAALALVVASTWLAGCAANGRGARAFAPLADPGDAFRRAEGRPPVVVVARDGDPKSAVAVAVTTSGIGEEHGASVAVALAALVESRLGASVGTTPSRDGFRARGLVANASEAAAMTAALRAALLTPVTAAELPAVKKKLDALGRRPLTDEALDVAARCSGEATGVPGKGGASDGPDVATLEAWRRAAVGLGRVALATAGSSAIGDAVADAIARSDAWPAAAAIADDGRPAGEARVYDATSDIPAGGARVTLAANAVRAEDAARAAEALGDPEGALAARLGGLDAPAHLREVTATAHARGGCLVVTFDLAARDLAVDAPAQIATAVALARQEVEAELAVGGPDGRSEAGAAAAIARRQGDPRDAADVAAWWALSTPDADAGKEPRVSVAVGLATGRDTGPNDAGVASRGEAIRAELDRAIIAWHEPVVEARTRVEAGQGEMWLALGSPCGTLAEMANDAGLGAAFAVAAADRANLALGRAGGGAEPWAAPDGLGVIVHGPALPGETPLAQARRLGDAVGRSFAAEPVDRGAVSRARARLLGQDERDDARALATLADAVAPGHPSWLAPMGPLEALGRSSDAAVAARASALRAGPLRLSVIANVGPSQAEAAVRAVDRWVARRPGAARACPMASVPPPPRPATYAVDARDRSVSSAWLAIPLPAGDAAARPEAAALAAALDGPDGLLARALGAGLARGWSARVLGSGRAAALVVRIDSAPGALDPAVAQTRALFDRLRQGSLSEADHARAAAALADRDLATSLDPARRLAALWRDPAGDSPPPTLDAVRAFAAAALRDDALIIVAVRPPRPRPTPKPPS